MYGVMDFPMVGCVKAANRELERTAPGPVRGWHRSIADRRSSRPLGTMRQAISIPFLTLLVTSAAASVVAQFTPFPSNPSEAEKNVLALVERHDATVDSPPFPLHPYKYLRLADDTYFVQSFTGMNCWSELDFVAPRNALVTPLGCGGDVVGHSRLKFAEWWVFSNDCENHGSGRHEYYAVVRLAAKPESPIVTKLVDVQYFTVDPINAQEVLAAPTLDAFVCDLNSDGMPDIVISTTDEYGVRYQSFIFSTVGGFTEQDPGRKCP